MKFQGSFPALITPFWENYTINFAELYQLLEMHARYSDGLVLLGSTGEGWLLSDLEQKQIVEQTTARFNAPIIVNMNCWSAAHFTQKLKLFEDSLDKITAFLLAVPPYLRLNSYQVINFYEECAQISPLPIIAYHNPSRNGVNFDSMVYEFFAAQNNIIGVKETVHNQLKNYGSQYRLALFTGEDNFILEPFVETSINVGGNLFPDIFSACPQQINWEKWQQVTSLGGNPLIIKELMFQNQLISFPGARPPLGMLAESVRHKVKALALNLLVSETEDLNAPV